MSLITKLDSNVTDTSLLQLGALRLKSKVVESPNGSKRVFGLAGPWSAKIIGDPSTCYFTDSTLTQNNGQEITFTGLSVHYAWVSNVECEIVVKPKYGITNFTMNSEGVYFDSDTFDDIGILPDCINIGLTSSSSAGDVAKLSGLASLKFLTGNFAGTVQDGITGDLDALKDLPLETIALSKTTVKATLEKLATIPSLKSLNLYMTDAVEGSVNAFANSSQFTSFRVGALRIGVNTKITGSITSLGKMINATSIGVPYTSVTGTCDDLAAALAANGKTSGTVSIQSGDGTVKSFTFPLA
jgi:hypothetical protein